MARLSGIFTEILVDVERHLARVQRGHESEVAQLRGQLRKLEDQDRSDKVWTVEEPVPEMVPTPDAAVGFIGKEHSNKKSVTLEVEESTQMTNMATTKSMFGVHSTKSTTPRIVRQTTAELNMMRDSKTSQMDCTRSSRISESLGDVPDFEKRREERDLSELEGRAYWAAQLESGKAEIFACTIIVLNTFLMAFEFQYSGLRMAHDRGIPGFDTSMEETWPHAEETFVVLDWVFTVVFTIELVVRIAVIQCPFFCKSMNWLDIVVVALSWVPLENIDMNPTIARLLRLGRLGRALRLFKIGVVLESLQLILKCIASSVHVLFWSILLLMVIQMIAGMFIGQILAAWLEDESTDPKAREEVYVYYGTFTRTFFTMFEVTLANWAPAARVLMVHVGERWSLFFMFYRCLVGFAVLSVISAIFVQQTLKVAQQDEAVIIAQKLRAMEDFAKKLQKLFVDLDTSGDGQISWDEFQGIMVDRQTKAFMQALEIDVSDLERLYSMLDDGDGGISVEEFALGVSRVKGPAKNIDIVQLLAKVGRMEVQMQEVHMMARDQVVAGHLAEVSV